MKEYLLIDFKIKPVEPGRDILLASLDSLEYDSFEETPEGLKAYIKKEDWDENGLKSLYIFQSGEYDISYETDLLENKNWNEEWESYYEPIEVADKLYIRASFHPAKPEYPLEVLIDPKMSFGTGHHQTTRLMATLMLNMEWKGLKVLDMGTGTGILAILAEKLGATDVTAIDNFDWAVTNTEENASKNNCHYIKAEHGDADLLPNRQYDAVLANINRNVLLEDMKTYVSTLGNNPVLLLSGFMENDFQLIDDEATSLGLKLKEKVQEGPWLACAYKA